MSDLRSQMIRLAHIRPELQPYLLPMLRKTALLQIGAEILSDNQKLRIKRSRDAVRVVDVVTAGKRGKTCRVCVVFYLDRATGDKSYMEDVIQHLHDSSDFNDASERLKLLVDMVPGTAYAEDVLKAIEVTPVGFKPILIITDEFALSSDYDTFTIRSKTDPHNEPVCIPAAKGKKSVKVFYAWVRDNESKIKTMTYYQVLSAMRQADIDYRSYCAMD